MKYMYLVYGTTGQYSDRHEWNVRVFSSQTLAENLKNKLNSLSQGLQCCYSWELDFEKLDEDSNWHKVSKELLKLDPQFTCDYTGTKYYVDKIESGD